MANILTAVQPIAYSAAQEVSNEPFGVISSISASFDDKGVAIGDTVKVPIIGAKSASDYTPAMTTTAGDDTTPATVDVTITANKQVTWNLTGEQEKSLMNGDNDNEWFRQQVAQGMRTLRNLAETACATAVKQGASRAVGTAGTNPFASDINIIADVRKVLFDNGAPMADLQMVIDSAAGTSARKLGIIQQAYQAGSEEERRSGDLLRQYGFAIRESAGIGLHTKGTGASYLANGAVSVGGKDITVDTGSGTILAGDIITYAADSTNKYVVGSALASNVFSVNRPGVKVAIPDNNAITVGNNYTANLAFERSAVVGIMRPPVMPENPLIQRQLISDKYGMTYMLVRVAGDGMATWRLHLAYGFKVVQSEHVAIVLG